MIRIKVSSSILSIPLQLQKGKEIGDVRSIAISKDNKIVAFQASDRLDTIHTCTLEGEGDEEGVLGEAFNFNATHGTTIDDDASVAIWRVLKKTIEGIPLSIALNVNKENGVFA